MSIQTITYWDDAINDGVTFPFTTLEVESGPIFAQDGIQLESTQYQFTVRGTITGGSVSEFAANLAKFRTYLSRRGLTFTVYWTEEDGTQHSPMYEFFGASDSSWGPTPGALRLTRFSGGLAAKYEWSVTARAKECFTEACTLYSPLSNVLSVTKQVSSQVDINGFTTRTIAGQLTLSAIAVRAGSTADAYRWYCEVGIPAYFKITNRSYACSPDGKTLNYSITMQEKPFTLPLPITNGKASFNINLQSNGLMAHFSLSGFFEAPYTVSKATLINAVVDLVESKLAAYLTSTTSPPFFEQQALSVPDMYDTNRVDFTFAGVFVAGTGVAGDPSFYATALQALVSDPTNSGGSPNQAYPYGGDANGSSGAGDELPYFTYDACVNPTLGNSSSVSITTTAGGVTLTPGGGGGGGVTSTPSGNVPATNNSGVSPAHIVAPYVMYHEEVNYCLDNGIEVFYPKRAFAVPVVQQSRPPQMTIIQAGYSVRYAQRNTDLADGLSVPNPIGTATTRVVLTADIPASNPEPAGDGSFFRWTQHWRYVMKAIIPYTDNINGFAFAMPIVYPQDPRVSAMDASARLLQLDIGAAIVDPTTT